MVQIINHADDHEQIKAARLFLEQRGLLVMDLRLAPYPIDPTAPDPESFSSSYHPNFEVGCAGQPLGYLPLRVVWIIAISMMAFGIGIANRIS
jgi:hypothetical protein